MAKSKIDIIYDMVNLAYDVKRQCGRDKTLNYYIGDYARDVIKAKDEKVYDEFIYLAKQLEAEGWEEFIDWSKNLIKEYNQIEESKKSIKESEENFVYYIAVYDEDGDCRGYLQNESWRITQDIDKAMHFKRDMDAHEVILKATKRAFNDDELYIEGMYLNESKESLKESYPNYDVDDVYKELKRLCDKGKNVFSEFYVERDENAFVVSISDDSSYIKLKDFIPYNIHYNENSFYMYYKNDSTYMTIFANYEDENAINVLVEVVRSLASLKGVHDKCETVSTEIVNQVSNLY